MTRAELLPNRVTYQTGESVTIEVRGVEQPGTIRVLHLGDLVRELTGIKDGLTGLGPLEPGGYGVEWRSGNMLLRTAVDVQKPDTRRMRYGFTATYRPGRDIAGLLDGMRRLHHTDLQCYDWAYRHADLLGGGAEYADALDQPIALDTVRRIAAGAESIGARTLGYAAVYAVGDEEWPNWQAAALLDATGMPYALADFLKIVDPAAPAWTAHFTEDLRRAAQEVGLQGFHLDQYGSPKLARRADGALVDLAASFTTLIEAVRSALPDARLVFNNVNDFPTAATAATPQDAVYIEVWEPNTHYGDLAALVDRARLAGGGKPVVIAAYQHVYDHAPAVEADAAAALTMATLASHGATHLLAGEEDRLLVDPYYVRNHVVEPSTATLLKRYADFVVEHDEVLFDPLLEDVTASMAGGYNDDCDVHFAELTVEGTATAGTVWRRVRRSGNRLVIHLINLAAQSDTLWDGPKLPAQPVSGGNLRIRAAHGARLRVRIADPDGPGPLQDFALHPTGTHAEAILPDLAVWQLIVVDLNHQERG